MGFDNECIVNIQSLPGEYFCPICRTLVYPNESLQAQCTHLYCKPCLTYVVSTTHACPYDGYLVTEADAKPLSESNKELSDTINKVAVHCLYHRSGCTWQGTLADCSAHCAGCSFGNSPVVCNRCGTQIVHSQVQEHAQICPGVQPAESSQVSVVTQDSSAVAKTAASSTTVASSGTAAASVATAASGTVPAAAVAAPSQAQAQVPNADQWYQQQQYQQYYQQYPGYDPYQQQYQQYPQYQQQGQPQYMQPQMQGAPQQVVPGQPQAQPFMQPQPQPHAQPQPQQQVPPHMQPPMQGQQQVQPPHGQIPGQPHPGSQPQARPPQLPGPPQQMPFAQPYPQQQLRPQHPPGPPHAQPQSMQPHSQNVLPAASGYQSYGAPQTHPMQMQPQQAGMPPQHPPQMQGQFPPNQPPQMRPPHGQMPMQGQPQPAMGPPQLPAANLHPGHQQPMPQAGMPQHGYPHAQAQGHMYPGQLQSQGAVPFQQQGYPQQPYRSQGPPHLQQHGVPAHQAHTRPMVPNQGMPQAPFQLSPAGGGSKPVQPGQSSNQAYLGRSASDAKVPVSPASSKQGASLQDKLGQLEDGMTLKAVEGDKSTDNVPDTKYDDKNKSAKVENGSNEHLENKESTEPLGTENADVKMGQGEEDVNTSNDESQGNERKSNEQSGTDKGLQRPNADHQQASQNMAAPGGFDRGQPMQAGYHDTHAQHPQHYPPAGAPFPPQQVHPHGHPPSMAGPTMVSQRPPAPDRMFQQQIPHPEPHPYHMQVAGQGMPPPHIRPPAGHNQSYPQQGQAPEAFWPRPQGGGPGQGLPPPPAGAPLHHGYPHPSGQPPVHMPPPHAGGARVAPGDPLARPAMVGPPPPGALDTPNRMMAGGVGHPLPVNPIEAEAYAIKRAGMSMNGMPDKAYDSGMHHSAYGPNMGEDRFNAPHDRFRPSALEPGRHANRREFEEDLKQFPRPAYLDEGPNFDGYMSSSRPSDRPPHVPGGASLIASRPPPPYQSGSLDVGERDRPAFPHEHMGRRHDAPEFGRHRLDALPPLRSPGRDYDGFSSSKFGLRGQSRREDFEERAYNYPPPGPGYYGRDIPDGPGSLRSDQPRRGLDGPHGFGGSRNYPGAEHGYGGFNGHFNPNSREGEIDSFEPSRMRKPISMGWCRICKIDCETVEGLDLHAQTREHQKTTMDLVLTIKQENSKKHKLGSENAMQFEDGNRSKKAKFENRGKRQ